MKYHYYEIYRAEGMICGTPIAPTARAKLIARYDGLFYFEGREHRFILVTGDNEIRREQALEFATAVAAGKVRNIHIDLSSLGRVKEDKIGKRGRR